MRISSRIKKIGNTKFLEYRPGKYCQLLNGKFANKISIIDLARLELFEKFGEVKINEIELAVVVSSVSVFFTTLKIDFSFISSKNEFQYFAVSLHLLAFVTFLASAYAAGRLYYTYLLQRFPKIYLKIGENLFKLQVYYINLWKGMFRNPFKKIQQKNISQTENEIGYLTILATFLALCILIIFSVGSSLLKEIYDLIYLFRNTLI